MHRNALILLFILSLTAVAGATSAPTLTVRVESDTVDYAAAVTLVVAFENRTDETLRYLEPFHTGSLMFPAVQFVSEETGAIYRAYDPPFQSMVMRGLQGAVIEVAPGGKHEYRFTRARFAPVVAGKMDWTVKRPLPPGKYRIEATYEKPDDKADYNIGGFDTERRSVPGIFVGRLTAEPATVVVRSADRPRVDIEPSSAGRAEITLHFDNHTTQKQVFAGRPRLVLASKMYGSGEARPALVRDGDAKPGEVIRIEVPAGKRKTIAVRLRALSFAGRGSNPWGLGELIPQGLAHARFSLTDPDGSESFATDGIFVRIPHPQNRGLEGICVTASMAAVVAAGEPMELTFGVENGGTKDALLLHRMAFPRDVIIRIDAAGRPSLGSVRRKAGGLDSLRLMGERASKVATGLSWNGDAFDPVGGVRKADLIGIEPGDGFERTLDLLKLLVARPTPGIYQITVGYRNYESGERLGIAAGHRAGVGIVWSKPVEVQVR